MFNRTPELFCLSTKNIKQKFNYFLSKGYPFNSIKVMFKQMPSLMGRRVECFDEKIELLNTYGYSIEEIMHITLSLPTIFCYSTELIKNKIEFYKDLNLENMIIGKPTNLMQSIEVTYARIKLLKTKGFTLNNRNYRVLFIDNTKFEKKYHINKKDLLSKYPYTKK